MSKPTRRFPADDTTRVNQIDLKEAFTENEWKNGIVFLEGTPSHQFYELLTTISVKDPITGEALPTLEEVESQLRVHCDAEMELASKAHLEFDRLQQLQLRPQRTLLEERQLLQQSSKIQEIHFEWYMTKSYSEWQRETWELYRDERVSNLERAYELGRQLRDADARDQSSAGFLWKPSERLMQAILDEKASLNRGPIMSAYYKIQAVTGASGKPLMAPNEISSAGTATGADDLVYQSPLPGAAADRIRVATALLRGAL